MKKYLGILLALSFSSSLWAGATFSRAHNWVDQEVLTAADLNAEFNNILNNLDPAGIDDYSLTLSQMQTTVDPYPATVESLATDLKGEIERLRYQVLQLKKSIQTSDSTYWYQDTPGQGTFTIGTSSVGVNNTSPSYSLDVTGTERVTGNSLVVGNLIVNGSIQGIGGFSLQNPLTVINAQKDVATNQMITAFAGNQKVIFGTEIVDRNSEFSSSSFTVVTAGYYQITCNLLWSTPGGTGVMYAYVNLGATKIHYLYSYASNSNDVPVTMVYSGHFNAGDNVWIGAESGTGSNLYLSGGGNDYLGNRINITQIP